MSSRRILAIALLGGAVLAGVGGLVYWRGRLAGGRALTLYGNVDIREVQIAFNDSDRIARMLVQEGDFVHRGELLAELDQRRYAANLARARQTTQAQRQVLTRLLNGSRPEEVVRARADMEARRADARNAEIRYRREEQLRRQHVIPQQQLDDSESRYRQAAGNYEAARQAWILAVKGPRVEEIEQARATLAADEAALALARRELADTRLYADSPGVIEDRILEPGDMASPSVPVFTMALTDPVWVRTYVPEQYLGRIHLGMAAAIGTDSYPGKEFAGWIGYISPTAEFTPKNVETPELRTRLVYQVRVFACNPQNELRLGMPATVTIDLSRTVPRERDLGAHGCEGERDAGRPADER